MNARLVGISGAVKGRIFVIQENEYSLGRDASNSLALADPAASRRHCVIQRENGEFWIRDLESRNGTLVNKTAVAERTLRSRDELKIGDSVLVFLLGDEDIESISARHSAPRPATQTFVMRPEDSMFFRARDMAAQSRTARDLAALLRISSEISRLGNTDSISRKLPGLVREAIPCERAVMVLLEGGAPQHSADRRAVLDSAAVLEDDRVLAVPLICGGRALAVVRLEAGEAGFDKGHLEFAGAVGAVSSLALENATRMEYLEGENRRLRAESELDHEMVGESARMRELFQLIARAAPSEATVLIQGESGTGKELVARAIHKNSVRAGKPFLAINCATLNENLLESELFGHEKGAFTGAVAQKRGKLEVAEGGTVFLDEIGEMAPMLQAKLLRVLQERQFERVGGTRTLRADIRLVAATNRDLQQGVRAGTFRQDLFYRLNVVTVAMPPLRERREDIPLLANYFAARFGERSSRRIAGISPAARACLLQYDWPGNVRELENAIERAVVLGSGDLILPEDLPEALFEAANPAEDLSGYHEYVREAKRKVILMALDKADGNQAEAARILGVNPTYLSRLIRNLGIRTPA